MIDDTQLKMIAQGNTAEIYSIDDTKILKLYRKGIPAFLCESEYNNTCAARNVVNTVPLAYELVTISDRYGIIFEKIMGTDMLNIITSKLWKINRQAKKLAKYHTDIQKEATEELPSVKEKLIADIGSTDLLSAEEKSEILAYIDTLPDGNILCHFDFHPGNIIIQENKPVIIDWMTACSGCRCADVARTGILLKYGQMPRWNLVIKKIVSLIQKRIYKIYVEEYIKISGVSQHDIDKWELPIMAARLHEWIPQKEKAILLDMVRDRLLRL